MSPNESAEIAEFAKQLFPVTSKDRITSLGVMLKEFPDPDFAKGVLVEYSHEAPVNALDIPTIRNRLNAELHRRGVHMDGVMREAEQRAEIRRREREAADKSRRDVDAFLAGLSAEDLATFKNSTINAMPAESRPFYAKLDPAKSVQLGAAMFTHLNTTVVQ